MGPIVGIFVLVVVFVFAAVILSVLAVWVQAWAPAHTSG